MEAIRYIQAIKGLYKMDNTALVEVADEPDYTKDDLALFSGAIQSESISESEAEPEPGLKNSLEHSISKGVIPVQNKPGRMNGDVTITLHTLQAHQMFNGRKRNDAENKPGITGLIRFAGAMNKIWVAAAHNDPYADYILFDIEQSLTTASEFIADQSADMTNRLDKLSQRGYRIDLRASSSPIDLPLRFAPEFTHKAALVLLDFDYMVRQALSLRHAAILSKRDWGYVSHTGRKLIRAAFEASLRFHTTNVTRDDIAANNPVAQKAQELYKFDIPKQILEGVVRAEVSPHLPALNIK